MITAGVKLSLDASDFVSGAGRAAGSLHLLNEKVEEARKLAESTGKGEDYDNFFKLKYDRDRMQSNNAIYDRNLKNMANNPNMTAIGKNGQQVFKMDADYVNIIKDQTSVLKKLYEKYNEFIKAGDTNAANAMFPQIDEAEKKLNKTMEEANRGNKDNNGVAAAVKSLAVGQIAQAIAQGFSQYTQSKDRTGIISAYGSGDLMGGNLAEMRRKSDFWGGIVKVGAPLAGTAIGAIAGNPILGGMIGSAGGSVIADLIAGGTINEANKVAFASLWSQQIPDMMSLAAITGDAKRPKKAFERAVSVSEDYGYSAEEGAGAIRAAAQQGLSIGAAIRVAGNVFDHERRTGADRDSLLSLATMSKRYGGEDNALRNSWRGLQASGMQTGQLSEILRGMQRVMEDGISKGFYKSSDEVARNLTMLASMTNNNPLWVGEQGTQRLMQMNSGLEGGKGLNDSTEMMMFMATRESLRADAIQKGLSPGTVSTTDVLERMEQGIDSDIFKRFIATAEAHDGRGNDLDIISRLTRFTSGSYTQAKTLYDSRNNILDNTQLNAMLSRQEGLPEIGSREQDAMRITAATVNQMTVTGQIYWEGQFPSLSEALENASRERGDARMGNPDYNQEHTDPAAPAMPPPPVEGDFSSRIFALLGQYGTGFENEYLNPFMADYNKYKSGENGHDTIIDRSEVGMLIPYLIEMARASERNTGAIESLINELGLDININ